MHTYVEFYGTILTIKSINANKVYMLTKSIKVEQHLIVFMNA